MKNKLIIKISENHKMELEIPEFFDYIAIEDTFGENIISVQRNYIQKKGWIDKQHVQEAINQRLKHFIDWRSAGRCGDNPVEIIKNNTAIKLLEELKGVFE